MDLIQLIADQTFLKSILDWAGLAALALGAIWAVITFSRNNRIKAAEIILDIEEKFKKHIKTLLQIEYSLDYGQKYKTAIIKAMSEPVQLDLNESEAIDHLEDALRHFYVCAYLKRLGVDAGTLDDACVYYLGILCSPKRPELLAYIQRFWPTIYIWSQLCKKPWPRRVVAHVRLAPQRIHVWWTGAYEQYAPRQQPSLPSPVQRTLPKTTTQGDAHGVK